MAQNLLTNSEDYRYISIYPTWEELVLNKRIGLRRNITKGAYPDIYNYLDIHFRLLREDFVNPLREDITRYLSNPTKKLENVEIHEVHFIRPGIKRYEKCFFLEVIECLKGDINIVNGDSQRFMTGSLVIFTDNNFKSMFCGKIEEYNNHNNIHKLLVSFENNISLPFYKKYLMVECKIFFAPYYNVLKVMQNMPLNKFPLEKYIIQAKTSAKKKAPKYLRGYARISVRDPSLNHSQMDALNGALSQEFTVIQGPPGTGKTFLGVKIAKTLLANSHLWWNQSPMLVVSYTNHALDQFLERLLGSTKDVLRLGEQSKSEQLRYHTVREMRKKYKHVSLFPVGKEYKMLSTINAHIASTIKLLDDKRRKDIHLEKADVVKQLDDLIKMRKPIYKTFERLSSENTLHLMKQMKVIGVTTTRAASMYSDLEELKCPIVIIEEAAEVLESHNISVLTPHCQQLLLIGDHQQLKPMTSDYNMQKTYDLGISLFERMVNNDMRCYTLNVQHRMRPELCSLITPTIYPILINHASTKQYPSISGIGKDLYFVDHDHAEEDAEEASKKNKFEVEFLIQLAIYLLNNNYQPEEITILATYLGQVKAFLRERQNIPNELLKKINITSVDNFQGEENKIILLSLVRNNQQSKIGFLAMENRVCVALSRAKEGLYIIGNMRQLSAKSKVWKSIKASLESQNAIGKHLPLTCKLHNKTTLLIHPSQFKRVKTGNCELPCNVLLKCGHMCTRRCHRLGTHDSSQCSVRCTQSTINPLSVKNATWNSNGTVIGNCKVTCNVLLKCGHKCSEEKYHTLGSHKSVQCSVRCTQLVTNNLSRSSRIIADYEYSNPSRYQPTPLQPANNWSCVIL